MAQTLKEYLDEKLKANSLRAPDRNPLVAPQADLAKKIKALLNQYETKKLGKIDSPWNQYGAGHSIGDLLFGQSPELLDDISYGLNPFTSGGKYGRLPIPDKRLLDVPVPTPAAGGLGVIKNKGGNWLTGSVENALESMKKPLVMTAHHNATDDDIWANLPDTIIEELRSSPDAHGVAKKKYPKEWSAARMSIDPEKESVNSWIDSTLTKYVKNRMATPDDEVRKLADQGILHYEPPELSGFGHVKNNRERNGFPIEGMAESDLARNWETRTDWMATPDKAKDYLNDTILPGTLKENSWLSKVDPESPVHYYSGSDDLGLPHLIDELLNAANPDSGLPMNLRIKPEGFNGLSMEEAVKKVHGINAFRAEQAKKVNERFAQAEGIPVYKDYGDGTRLLEYKLPDELPKGIEVGRDGGFKLNQDYYETADEVKKKQLESWLKQEGDTMGHCVGGYCDAVTSGQSRILSLRDKDGKSRATIELRPEQKATDPSYVYRYKMSPERQKEIDKLWDPNNESQLDWYKGVEASPEWRSYLEEPPSVSIVQIKGPGNRAPDPDVLPYLQDFVKSGNWSDVSDLQNTGLERLSDFRDSVVKRAREAGLEGDYFTPDEIYKYLDPDN